jgi:hypothetical protein
MPRAFVSGIKEAEPHLAKQLLYTGSGIVNGGIRAGRGPAPMGGCSVAKYSANGISFCDDRACCPPECHSAQIGAALEGSTGPAGVTVGWLSRSQARWPLRQ